jgi:tripartite ATP-independent transporter DctP family solute receptor
MKRHVIVCVALLLGVGFALAGDSAAQDKPIVLKWGHSYPPDHPSNVGAKKMAEVVAAKTGGKIKIDLYPGGQLGSDKDNIEGTIMGTQDMLLIGSGGISQFSPRLGIGECPYIWRDIDHMNTVMDGPVGDELREELLKGRGLRVLNVFYYGRRHLTSNKSITKPDEMKGFKLRTPQVPVIMEMAKAWGATPTPMNIGDLYLALKTGVVDGQENPTPTINGFKFYEAQKFLMLTEHIITPLPMIINERVWRTLSPDNQKIMLAAAQEARELNNKLMLEQEDAFLDAFKKAGMTIVKPDVEAFRKASAGVAAKFESTWGKGLYEKILATK